MVVVTELAACSIAVAVTFVSRLIRRKYGWVRDYGDDHLTKFIEEKKSPRRKLAWYETDRIIPHHF